MISCGLTGAAGLFVVALEFCDSVLGATVGDGGAVVAVSIGVCVVCGLITDRRVVLRGTTGSVTVIEGNSLGFSAGATAAGAAAAGSVTAGVVAASWVTGGAVELADDAFGRRVVTLVTAVAGALLSVCGLFFQYQYPAAPPATTRNAATPNTTPAVIDPTRATNVDPALKFRGAS